MFFWATVESNEDSALNRLSELVSEGVAERDEVEIQKKRDSILMDSTQDTKCQEQKRREKENASEHTKGE